MSGLIARALVRPLARSLPWRNLAAAGALGLALAAVPRFADLEAGVILYLLRMAALAGALGAAFVLDDPSRETTEVVPASRALRQALRVAVVLPALAAWWMALLYVGDPGHRLPWAALTLEAVALCALAWAMAGAALRFTASAAPGLAVGGILLVLFIASALIPPDQTPLVPLGHSNWSEVHSLWTALLVLSLLSWAATTREPTPRRHPAPQA
ncbi:hypothetical protein [Spirillospora sp. NPDC029432]|uniref:hypothetical protein n=1 Tax=Spirillospora sp. NPDC029432 TaxID=3154599 RepID=UPI0034533C77